MAAPWISSPEMAMRDPGQGGRHRQTWRWSTPARIVGCGDASSRSVATAGDLVPSSAMAMLQLDVRGLVVSASSDAAMLERGEKKRHCCKVSDEAAFCLIQRPYISKTLLTRRISPR
ncbi:hypothetical protein SMA73_23660, partial [Escherichia coli]